VIQETINLAAQLLSRDGIKSLRRIDDVPDEDADDDNGEAAKLFASMSGDFDRVEAILTQHYGEPSRTGTCNDDIIPMHGVFRFAVWPVGEKQLFAAALQETRGYPIELVLGTSNIGETGEQAAFRRRVEKDAAITQQRCPFCALPLPPYRKTCNYCGKSAGRAAAG
jgi:hypothetical protein